MLDKMRFPSFILKDVMLFAEGASKSIEKYLDGKMTSQKRHIKGEKKEEKTSFRWQFFADDNRMRDVPSPLSNLFETMHRERINHFYFTRPQCPSGYKLYNVDVMTGGICKSKGEICGNVEKLLEVSEEFKTVYTGVA